jgi:hypothetical protein
MASPQPGWLFLKRASWLFLISVVFIVIIAVSVLCVPSGPTITYKGTSTSSAASVPALEGNASIEGGYITVINLVAPEANDNWKGYVGNVSGSLVLEDSSNFSIYEWGLATPTGEVYATRTATSVVWENVKCANASNVAGEQTEMGHLPAYTPTDSINITFTAEANDHWGFVAGAVAIANNSCAYSINPWVADAPNAADQFEEVLLYDGINLIYTSRIENNLIGYKNDGVTTYDFEMLVAENASPGAPRTDYYFYVELV